jgi:Caspase domain
VTPILPPHGRVIAYVVGLENYVGTGKIKPVDYARRDAQAFAETLRVAFPDREVDVMTRIDDEATRSVLEDELPYTISGVHEDDLFVFYFAGHGLYGDGGNRLTAYDSYAANLGGTTWPVRELLTDPLASSACGRALVFIDACAEKLEAPGRSVVRPIDPVELEALVAARFHAVFMSCEPNQSSYGSAQLQHGIWTHFLLRALRGEAAEALGPGRLLTGDGLREYLRRQVPVFAAKEVPGRVQRPYALIGSSGDFAIAEVPEGSVPLDGALAMPPGTKDLVAIGPKVVAVGEMLGSDGSLWKFAIDDFVIGTWNDLANFVDDFENVDTARRYVLVNARGEGRMISGRPAWRKNGNGGIEFTCDVAPPAERIPVERLPSTWAVSPKTGDMFAERGAIARTSGAASLPQMLQSSMSLVRGESFWDLGCGSGILRLSGRLQGFAVARPPVHARDDPSGFDRAEIRPAQGQQAVDAAPLRRSGAQARSPRPHSEGPAGEAQARIGPSWCRSLVGRGHRSRPGRGAAARAQSDHRGV